MGHIPNWDTNAYWNHPYLVPATTLNTKDVLKLEKISFFEGIQVVSFSIITQNILKFKTFIFYWSRRKIRVRMILEKIIFKENIH